MSTSRAKVAAGKYRMLLERDELSSLLETLAKAGVNSFAYEDAKVKLEIVIGMSEKDGCGCDCSCGGESESGSGCGCKE